MKTIRVASRVVLVALLAASLLHLTGCESSDDTSTSLSVSPSSVTFDTTPDSVTFTVSGPASTNTSQVLSTTLGTLSLPLVWSVSNPGLGLIVESSGNQAVYQRTASSGINVVTVLDQYGQRGIATVTQGSTSTTSPTTPSTPSNITLSVAGGVVTMGNIWSDGTAATATFAPGQTGATLPLSNPGLAESHTAVFSSIEWDVAGTTITSFTLVVDGTTTYAYP